MRHFITTEDWTRSELQALIDRAKTFRKDPAGNALQGRSVALLFFNPSLRTRTSFEVGIHQLGGQAIILQPGKDAWPIEFELGTKMDGETEEHVKEAAGVLSRYVDMIAIRAFPKFENWQEDRQDKVIRAFEKYASVPVINMETVTHPCQELALMMAIQKNVGNPDGKKFLLTWTYHPRPLNTAVANSALMIAAKFGMEVTLLCPNEDYLLDPRYMKAAESYAMAEGRTITVTHDIEQAYAGARMVYAKSWGALPYFGRWQDEKPIREAHQHFIVDEQKMAMTDNACFSHCLPLRRNVKATDGVVESENSLVLEEAENRLHVQKALMEELMKSRAS